MREKYKVIRVADIIFFLKLVFNKLIELVHINIHQKLAREIAQRQTLDQNSDIRCPSFGLEATNDFAQEPEGYFCR